MSEKPPALRRLGAALDMNDRFFFAGLLVAAIGGCLLSVAWTLVVVGAAIAIVGITGTGAR